MNPDQYYDQAANAFNKGYYKLADSLFTRSIYIKRDKDSYYYRGLSRLRSGNTKGFCNDVFHAAAFYGFDILPVHWQYCGTIDTLFLNENFELSSREEYAYLQVTYSLFTSVLERSIIYNTRGKAIGRFEMVDSIGKVYYGLEVPANFTGTGSDYYWYFKKNLKSPPELKKFKGPVFYWILAVVDQNGSIMKIVSTEGSAECKSCKEEAIRVLMGYPKWKPGKFKGEAVKSYLYTSIKFENE